MAFTMSPCCIPAGAEAVLYRWGRSHHAHVGCRGLLAQVIALAFRWVALVHRAPFQKVPQQDASWERHFVAKSLGVVTPSESASLGSTCHFVSPQESVKQGDFVRSKSFLMPPAKPAVTQRQGSKLNLKEGLQRGISLSHQNLGMRLACISKYYIYIYMIGACVIESFCHVELHFLNVAFFL